MATYETPDGRLDVFGTTLDTGAKRYIIMDHANRVAYNFENATDAGMVWELARIMPDMLDQLASPGHAKVYETVRMSDEYNADYYARAAARATREAEETKD